MGHRQSKNQRSPALPKTDKRAKERSSKRASALRSSIIIRIRMLKMESKDLTNNLNVKCDDQKSKCSCNDNNGHQSKNTTFNNQNTTITTLPSSVHNQYIQPDAQSNKMNNEEIEHLEDRINQINNDNSTTFVARRNQYNNRSTNNINNNIINDNETNSDAIGRIDTEIKVSAICDNVTSESDRIQMELKNIGVNNYKRSNLLMHRGCDNKMLLSSFDQQQFVDGVPANTKPMNNSSIYPNANNATTVTTPSTSKGPDYIPMAPIKTSDKSATEQNALMSSELANSLKQMGLPSTEDCTKDPKDKETKSKITNWSKKFNCVKILSPKSSSHIHHHHQQQQLLQPSSSRSHRQNGVTDTNNSIVKHADTRILSDHHRMAAEAVRRLLDFDKFNPLDYPTEDCDEVARVQRAREINEGVDPPPGYRTICADPLYVAADPALDNRLSTCSADDKDIMNAIRSIPDGHIEASGMLNTSDTFPNNMFSSVEQQPRVIHSQVDFIHCLVPDLRKITNCGFYWGVMDRYEAERLLEGKPEGTFLLRDSAQEEFLFSVSFRKYGRSLHARIEQFNHKFSFDCHDPGVFTSPEVTGLLEHYKDPACVMFFEPALTQPLNRNFCFTLQQLCRSLIVSSTTYDGVNELPLPSTLKSYLKEYHYKQRVRVRRYDQ